MVSSKATSVSQYLKELPDDRRAAITAIRKVIRGSIDAGIEEIMSYGMIGYHVPLRIYPAGYHCNPEMPLPYVSLASQKNHMAIYMMGLYMDADDTAWFCDAWKAAGKKLNMGKSCVRFKKLEDVPLEVVAEAIKRMPSKRYIETYEAQLAGSGKLHGAGKGPAGRKAAAKKAPAKKTGKENADDKEGNESMSVFTNIDNGPTPKKAARKDGDMNIEDVYQKKTQLEHILLRPDTYIGSIEKTEPTQMWVWDNTSERMEQRELAYVPGLYKIFDEIVVNAADNKQRDSTMNTLKIEIKP